MKRIKTWFLERFLPAWAKDTVWAENRALRGEIDKLKGEVACLNAYIDGLEYGVRAQRRLVLHNEVKA
jgi:hypothetical protein